MKPMARRTDPSTSHEAAAVLRNTGMHVTQQDVAAALVSSYPGKTYRELWERYEQRDSGVFENSVGLMRRLGEVATKAEKRICTISGRRAVTWLEREA